MKKILSSPIFILLLLSGVALAFLALGNQIQKTLNFNLGVSELEAKLIFIEEGNKEIVEEIASFSDEDTIEREARERLNLKREGEYVVIILPGDEEQADAISDDMILELYEKRERGRDIVPERPNSMLQNVKSWFNLFFR